MSGLEKDYRWRWLLSQTRNGGAEAVARDYTTGQNYQHIDHSAPGSEGWVLAHCQMSVGELVRARKDSRIIVLPSIHDDETDVHHEAIAAHAHLGATSGMKMRHFLLKLAETDPRFEPMH